MFGIIFRFSPFFKKVLLPTKIFMHICILRFCFVRRPSSFIVSEGSRRSPEGILQFSAQEFWQGGVRDPKLNAAQKQAELSCLNGAVDLFGVKWRGIQGVEKQSTKKSGTKKKFTRL